MRSTAPITDRRTMCMLLSALERRTSSCMFAQGALSARYSAIAEQKLPSRFGFAFLQDKEVNRANHPDCYKSNAAKNSNRVRLSEIDGNTPVAIDRLHVVMDQGQSQGSQVDQIYHPDVEDVVTFAASFVHFDGNFSTHDAALADGYNPGRSDNTLAGGISEWATIYAKIPRAELDSRDAETFKDTKGHKRYRLEATMVFQYKGDSNISVGWKIKTPKGTFDVEGLQLWDARHSPFSPELDD